MKIPAALVLLTAPSLFGAYQYYYSDALVSIYSANWTQNGSLTPTSTGLTAPPASSGSLISKVAVPDGTSEYEVKSTLTLAASGGTYVQYFRATADAHSGPSAAGTYYAVELQNPTFTSTGCTATLAIYKRVTGVITLLYSSSVVCRNGMTIRTVAFGHSVVVYLDDWYAFSLGDGAIAAGQPGVGVRDTPAGNSIAFVALGPLDRVPSPPLSTQWISTWVTPDRVDMQWPKPVDDPNGAGIGLVQVYRNEQFISNMTPLEPNFSDPSVAPSTTYTYRFQILDAHFNYSTSSTISVTTAPAGSIDARRVGVRPTGAYWGAMGEQIDMLSGNLNFTQPLFSAQGRNGWSVPFALNYNSQLWRKDPSAVWKLGHDVGYGFGWRLLAGSITAFWSDSFNLHHFVFMDSTGAEYRLDINNNGIWSSREGIHLWYDDYNRKLYFPDGSFWVMGCISAGTEGDAGTRYPTKMQDTNGNFINIRYNAGVGVTWTNSSSRIKEVEDVRGMYSQGNYLTYWFTYNSDPIPHLTQISASPLVAKENYTFTYQGNQSLFSPFAPQQQFGTTALLQTISGMGVSHQFEYGSLGSGEMSKVTFAYGGSLSWLYREFTFSGGRTQREVEHRKLKKAAGAAETNYFIGRDAADADRTAHIHAHLFDPSGPSRVYWFHLFPFVYVGWWNQGLLYKTEERTPANAVGAREAYFTWAQDANGNIYLSTVTTTLDPNTAYQKQSKVEQVVDIYGNLTERKVYDYNNLSTPARTYTNTYLTSSEYTSRYMFNRLKDSRLTVGGQSVFLVQNYYDYDQWALLTQGQGYQPPAPLPTIQQHDSANYGPNFQTRGNVTSQRKAGILRNYHRDITGMVDRTIGGGPEVRVTSTRNYAVPGVITPGSLTNTLTWTTWLGLQQVTDQNGTTATTYHDSFGRPASTTSPHGATTTHAYSTSPPTYTATTNGRWVKTSYDGLGRTIKVERGHGTTTVSTVDTEYDSCACSPIGKVKRVSQPYAPGGAVYWTTYTYDHVGRPISVSLPDNTGTTSYVYEGNTVKVTDPAGKWKIMEQNAMGNLTRVIEPNPAGGANHETLYSYDMVGNLAQVSMTRHGSTQTRTFSSTVGGLPVSATNPENGTVTYTYNGAGQVVTKTDAKGQRFEYSYDWNGRLTQIRAFPTPSNEDIFARVTYHYDGNPLDPGFSQYTLGRLAAVEYYNGSFAEMYSYTLGGRVTKKRLRVSSFSSIVGSRDVQASWTYDNEGRMTSVSYPDGTTSYTYAFDAMGRPNKLTDASQVEWVKNVQYGPADELKQMAWLTAPGGYLYAGESRTYNARLQLTRLSGGSGYPGQNVDWEYRYSATQNNGRMTQMKDWVTGEEVSYQYDSLNRLTSAATTGPEWGLSFGYDGFGNKVSQTVTKGTGPAMSAGVDPATNRVLGGAYDANGNPGGGIYDVYNRLTMVGGDQYLYGPDNRRVYKRWQQISGEYVEEVYFYGVGGERLMTLSLWEGNLWPFARNVYFGRRMTHAGQYAVVQDRLGSVRIADGQRLNYYPYGEERPSATTQDRDKFATYFRDKTSGLDYAHNRYYASTIGRFTTPDPYVASASVTNPQSWNRYAYVENDPVNLIDPAGLQAEGPPLNPYQGILDLIAGRLRQEFIESLHTEIGIPLTDYERVKNSRTAEFRSWTAEALKKLGPGCIEAFGSLLGEMIDRVSSVHFLDLSEPSHAGASLSHAFAGGSLDHDPSWQQSIVDWTGDNGQSWGYAPAQFNHVILGLGFTLSHSPEGLKELYEGLTHEMLHLVVGDDRQVANRFKLSFVDPGGREGITNAGRAIDRFLKDDCIKR